MSTNTTSSTVRDLMTTRLTTVTPDETVGAAMELMLYGGIRHLPVVRGDELVGLVSEHDLLPERVTAAFPALSECPVEEAMTTGVHTAGPDDDLGAAAARMADLGIHSLPVVDDGRLVGIITSTDILAERGRSAAVPSGQDLVPAENVMQGTPVSVTARQKLSDAVGVMLREKLHEIPVVDSDDRVVGMLRERDLRAALGDPLAVAKGNVVAHVDRLHVEQVMTGEPLTVLANATLTTIARCFLDERVGVVPVVDSKQCLVGIVTYLDLFEHLLDRSG